MSTLIDIPTLEASAGQTVPAGGVHDGLLLAGWIPALDGVEDKLRSGAMVAEICCGHGPATIVMASAFPRSAFAGYDADAGAIAAARASGSGGNVRFQVADADRIPAYAYDLVTSFDALRRVDDAAAAARRIHDALAADGTWLVVEPLAAEDDTRAVLADAGFGRVRVVAQTALCIVIEART